MGKEIQFDFIMILYVHRKESVRIDIKLLAVLSLGEWITFLFFTLDTFVYYKSHFYIF